MACLITSDSFRNRTIYIQAMTVTSCLNWRCFLEDSRTKKKYRMSVETLSVCGDFIVGLHHNLMAVWVHNLHNLPLVILLMLSSLLNESENENKIYQNSSINI